VILKKTEEAFWRLTPREFNSLIDVHIQVNTPKSKKDRLTPIDHVL